MDPYEPTKHYAVIKTYIPIMIESFGKGNRFVIDDKDYCGPATSQQFEARRAYYYDNGNAKHCFRVTNDQRRRLLPILKNLIKIDDRRPNGLLGLLNAEYQEYIYERTLKKADTHQCPLCACRTCTYKQVQARSTDETMKTIFTCGYCGYKWTV